MPIARPLSLQCWLIPRPDQDHSPPPPWIVKALVEGDLDVNTLGGMSLNAGRWSQTGLPGDFVVLYENGKLEIIDRDEFDLFFED